MTRPALRAYAYRMAQRQIRPPKPPPFPDQLPFQAQIDSALDRAAVRLQQSPFSRLIRRFEGTLPSVEATQFPTPLGTVRTPHLEFPSFEPPQMDDRRKKATKAAVAQDLAFIVGFIPVVGDAVADVVEDVYFQNIAETLTPAEFETFKKLDTYNPSTVAMLRAFGQHRR